MIHGLRREAEDRIVLNAETRSLNVIILGGAQGSLALARSLGDEGARVFYISNDSPLAGWSRHTGKMHGWPGPENPEAAAFLRQFAREHGIKGALLVPAADPEVKFVSQSVAALGDTFRILLPEWERLRWLCDKPLLYRRAAELGLAFAKTYELTSVEQAETTDLAFPVILKPNMGGGHSALSKAKVIRADDRTTFHEAFARAADELGAENIVVQQFIPGGGEGQFSYAALWADGKPVAELTARRARQYPVDFGFTSTYVETVDMPEIAEAARRMLDSVAYSGLVEIEFKRDPRNGSINILDVNPRPWSWFALAKAANVDLGRMMLQLVEGQPVEQTGKPRLATGWMYLVRDLVASAILMGRGRLKPTDYLKSLPLVRAWAAFAFNDPKPGLLDLPLTAYRVLTRRVFDLSGEQYGKPSRWLWRFQPIISAVRYNSIRAGLELTALPFVQRLFPEAAGRGAIFTLHHVRPGGKDIFHPNALLSVTPEFLEDAIKAALERGLTPVHLHDLPALLADPSDKRKFVAFTLDDGYRNNAEFAAPVFRKYGVPYTIFINPGFVERTRTIWWETAAALVENNRAFDFDFGEGMETVKAVTRTEKYAAFDRLAAFVQSIDEDEAVRRIDAAAKDHGIAPMAIVEDLVMTADELRELCADPLVHLGAHTINHINLKRANAKRLHEEITGSMARIEAYVGKRPLSFSFPYGWSTATGPREAEAALSAGVHLAVTTQPGILKASRLEKRGEMPRISLNGYYQKKRYVAALLSGIPFRILGGH